LERLKADAASKDIAIIMMSAHPDAEVSCKEAGANDFLSKPFDIDHFLKKINTFLN